MTALEIGLTDFGLAEPESKGGTPVFASPECFEKKEKKSDIFSFGRVILFLSLTKEQFLSWLFVPIRNGKVPIPTHLVNLVAQMTSIAIRLDLHTSRIIFNELRKNSQLKPNDNLVRSFDTVVKENLNKFELYISELAEFR